VNELPADAQDEIALGVEASRDVRSEVVAALVNKGVGVLELRRAERELESVFLRLAAADAPDRSSATKARAARAAAKAAKAATEAATEEESKT
jgi:ABC-2 type transport system ATP-binding protein